MMQSRKGIGTIKSIQQQPPITRITGTTTGTSSSRPFRKRRLGSRASSLYQHPSYRLTQIIVFGTIIAFIFGYTIIQVVIIPIVSLWVQQRQSTDTLNNERLLDSLSDKQNRLFDLPYNVENFELWVAPTNIKILRNDDMLIEQELRQHMEQQCLPSENELCRRSGRQSNTERIGILRPPGRLGHIIEDYVTKYVQKSHSTNTDDDQIITIQTQPNHEIGDWTMSYTKIIRPIVMPILLEVFDVMIQTTIDNGSYENNNNDDDEHSLVDIFTVSDVVTTLRILIQYHCYNGQFASVSSVQRIPTLTISLHHFMTYPQEINMVLIEFLNLVHQHSKFDQTNLMESYAKAVFQLYDTSTTLLQQMIHKYDRNRILSTNRIIPSLYDLIKSAIRQELNHDYCNGDLQSVVSTGKQAPIIQRFQFDNAITDFTDGTTTATTTITRMISSPTTEMIRTIFVENSLMNVCKQYPKARLCKYD